MWGGGRRDDVYFYFVVRVFIVGDFLYIDFCVIMCEERVDSIV